MNKKIYSYIRFKTRTLISKQLFPSLELERKLYERALKESREKFGDLSEDEFLSYLYNDAMLLISNIKFRDECRNLGLDVNSTAIHVAFSNKTDNVIREGLIREYGKDLFLVKRVFLTWEEVEEANKRITDKLKEQLKVY